jgi:hypothetical protein
MRRLKLRFRTILPKSRRHQGGGSSASRLWRLDLNLLRNQKGIVDVDPKILYNALDLGVAEQKLDGSKIAGSPIDHRGFERRSEWVP